MGERELNELIRKTENLNQAEKLQLVAHFVERCRIEAQKGMVRRKWKELRGMMHFR